MHNGYNTTKTNASNKIYHALVIQKYFYAAFTKFVFVLFMHIYVYIHNNILIVLCSQPLLTLRLFKDYDWLSLATVWFLEQCLPHNWSSVNIFGVE